MDKYVCPKSMKRAVLNVIFVVAVVLGSTYLQAQISGVGLVDDQLRVAAIALRSCSLSAANVNRPVGRFEHCLHLYFDLGSNIGVQTRKLFEAEKYPNIEGNTTVLPFFTQLFGEPELRRNKNHVCSFGLEANPSHMTRLKCLDECYNRQGWNTQFENKVVWFRDHENMTIFSDPRDAHEDWGAGVLPLAIVHKPQMRRHEVPTVDIARYIRERVDAYKPQNVFMKMDIEGSEHKVLPHLLEQGILCRKYITKIVIEFHPWSNKAMASDLNITKLRALVNEQQCNATKIADLDDETYLHDLKPLPFECYHSHK